MTQHTTVCAILSFTDSASRENLRIKKSVTSLIPTRVDTFRPVLLESDPYIAPKPHVSRVQNVGIGSRRFAEWILEDCEPMTWTW